MPALEDMLAQGLVGDGRPFTVAIKALGDNGQTSRALRLLAVGGGGCHVFLLDLVLAVGFDCMLDFVLGFVLDLFFSSSFS